MNSLICKILQTEAGRRIELQMLMNLVTSSLRLPRRNLLGRASAQSLDAFAAFTAEQLAACSKEQRQTLHANAYRLGTRLRRCLMRRDTASLTSLVFLLYRNIGIHMEGRFPGEVTVRSCHFSRPYSPRICSIASAMDSGVICGLFGGGQLVFHQRITEGHPCCQCTLASAQNIETRNIE